MTKEEVLKLFDKADVNGDGEVTRDEFVRLLTGGQRPEQKSGSREHEGQGAGRGPAAGHGPRFGHHGGTPQGFGQRGGFGHGPFGPGGFGPGAFGGGGFGTGGPVRGGFGGFPGGFGPRGFGGMAFGPGRPGLPPAQILFDHFDKDGKGFLAKDTVPEPVWNRISKADANQDGKVTKEELETYRKSQTSSPGGESGEQKQPADKTDDSKPKDEKPKEESKVTLQRSDELPADALAAVNQTT